MSPTRLQLEGPSLEELLERVQREHGAAARIVQAEKVRSGGIGGFFAREVYQIEVDVDAVAPAPELPVPRMPLSLLDLADAVSDEEVAASAPRPPAARRPAVSTELPSFAAVLAGLSADVGDEDDFVALSRPKPAARKATVREEPVVATPPAPMVLRAVPAPEPGPAIPAYAPGQVVAVVGDLPLALAAVRAVARELGIGEPEVYVASTDPARLRGIRPARRLADPGRIADQRARWSRVQETTFVVVDAPLLLRPEGWARSVLDATRAHVTWGAVSATTKVADIERWADLVGGVDALAVHDVAASVDASDVLSGRIAVGLVDGVRPARPVERAKRGVA